MATQSTFKNMINEKPISKSVLKEKPSKKGPSSYKAMCGK